MVSRNGIRLLITLALVGVSLAGLAAAPASATTCVLLDGDVEDTIDGARCIVNDTQCMILSPPRPKCIPV